MFQCPADVLAVRAGSARALSLREKFFAQAASPSKAPRVTTPAVQIPPADGPAADQPALQELVEAPTTPAQPEGILGLQSAITPLQAPAEAPTDTATLPDQAPAQSADTAAPLQIPTRAAPAPARAADLQPADASVSTGPVPESSAELADTTASPSSLIRELATREERSAESDEADKALSVLMAQLPASAEDISAPAQQALAATARLEPAHTKEAARDMQEGVALVTQGASGTAELYSVAAQPASALKARVARAEEVPAQQAALQPAPVQGLLVVPAERPASSAAPVPEEVDVANISVAITGKNAACALPEKPEEVQSSKAREKSAGLQQMQGIQVAVGSAAQHLKPGNPFFELKSFDPELLQAAKQQRSMSLNSALSTDAPQNEQSLPSNPFFETRGPASSPEQLLKHATLYFLAGESPSATAADLGIIPMSRANTEPLSGENSVVTPAVTANPLGPKTPRQPDTPPDKLAPAPAALLPAKSAKPLVPLAPVAEQSPAERLSGADADVGFLDQQPSAQPKPLPSTSSEGDASSRQSSHDTSSGKSSDIYLPAWKGAKEAPAEAQTAVKADAAASTIAKGKDKVVEDEVVEDIAAANSAPNSGHLPSWLPSTPGQSMETFPKAALIRQGEPRAHCCPIWFCH